MKTGFSRTALVAAMLAGGCLGAAAQTPGFSDGTVRIGVLTDMAGVFSDLGGAEIGRAHV